MSIRQSKVVRKLVTKEDPQHIHKVFGMLCVLNFVYRYCYIWPTTGDARF